MTMPEMVPANIVRQLTRRMELFETALKQLTAASGTLGGSTVKGDLKLREGGSLSVEDGGGIFMGPGGRYLVTGADTYVQILEDSFSIGTLDPVLGFTWPSMSLLPDGFLAAKSASEYAVFRVDAVDGAAVVSSSVGIVRLPYQTTGDSANTRILFDGTILMVASSERYKTDIAPIEVDVDELRAYQGISWIHKDTMDSAPPGYIRRSVGHHAEAMDRFPSLRQFVNYDDEGRPDSVEDPRFAVAVHEAWKHTDAQVTELEQTVADQADEIAALKRQNTAILAHLGLDALPPSADDPQE